MGYEILVVKTTDPVRKEFHREYCGRGSLWGNPYVINDQNDRNKVIVEFAKYFYLNEDKFIKDLNRLVDISEKQVVELACFCSPKVCHCDIIKLRLLNMRLERKLNEQHNI